MTVGSRGGELKPNHLPHGRLSAGSINRRRAMSTTTLRPALAACAAAVALAALASSAQAAPTRVGMLTCEVSGGVGMIITSSKALACTFRPQKGAREAYAGTVRKFGLDIGATSGGRLVWAVYAPTRSWQRGALAGAYT
jgi:hypothetical protein